MTREEAIEVIQNASEIFANVRAGVSPDGTAHHYDNFRIQKEDALLIMKDIDAEYEPNLRVLGNGRFVIIGTGWTPRPIENPAHFDDRQTQVKSPVIAQ